VVFEPQPHFFELRFEWDEMMFLESAEPVSVSQLFQNALHVGALFKQLADFAGAWADLHLHIVQHCSGG